MENTESSSLLESIPVGRLMRRYALPCVISLTVAALYKTVVFPMTVVALAIAVMIGDGACAFVSLSLGRRDVERAHRSIGNAVVLSIVSSLVLTALYLILAEPILTAFGGGVNERTMEYSREYFFWITLGMPFYIFGQAMNPIIRSDGSPTFAMVSTLAGAVANIILDPIFIFGFRLGMAGAAIATVIGQILTAVLAIRYFTKTKAVKLERSSFKLDFALIREFLALGICSFLAQISLVAAMAAIQNMVKKYGALDPVFGAEELAQIPMPVLGVVMKVFQIIISIVIGMAAGCIPIVGYNVGARRFDRARELLTRLMLGELAVGIVALVIFEIFPRELTAIFGSANESIHYAEFAVKSFRTYLCMLPLATVNKAAFIFLQSLGKAKLSTFLSMPRELVLGVGLALLLPLGFGLDGVLYSMPTADLLTFIASAVIIATTYRSFNRELKS